MAFLQKLGFFLFVFQGIVQQTAAISFTSDDSVSVAEDTAAGTTVLTLAVTDAAAGAITYTIQGSPTPNLDWFEVADTDKLKVKGGATLDFEDSAFSGATRTISLLLRAVDTASASIDQPFTVTITDVNEGAPAFGEASGYIFVLTSPLAEGSAVGTVAATDAADTAVTLDFEITDGDTNGYFEIADGTGALTTKAGKTLTDCHKLISVEVNDVVAPVGTATTNVVICVGDCADNCDSSGSSRITVTTSTVSMLGVIALVISKI